MYGEGQQGGGFDVRIGSTLFLQFKLCERLTRRSAKETKVGLIEPPFYRFWLHRRNHSSQHNMLIDLESQPGNRVYCIAPGFAELAALNASYAGRRVVSDSAMFSPTDIGPLRDDGAHRVAFRLGDPTGWFMSEPRAIHIHRKEDVLDFGKGREVSADPARVEESLYTVAGRMKDIIARSEGKKVGSLLFQDDVAERRDPLQEVAYLARAYFSCEVLFVVEPR
ncbi:MAG TPA: hypothetical protein VLY24_01855 [Bryobacteraceae bacterium]|nr:hypothetical protein [Bryobacteraceae bacterium]